MRYLKMFGIAAIAVVALMAVVGAGSASASRLCKTTVEACPEAWDWPAKTEISSVLVPGTKAVFETDPASGEVSTMATCEEAALRDMTTNTGSAVETVDLEIIKEHLTWNNCSGKVVTVKNGILEIHAGKGGDGVATMKNLEVTFVVTGLGVSCTYGAGAGVTLGTLTEPATNEADTVLDVAATLGKTAGLLCPQQAVWTAEYTVKSPIPLYVTAA